MVHFLPYICVSYRGQKFMICNVAPKCIECSFMWKQYFYQNRMNMMKNIIEQ